MSTKESRPLLPIEQACLVLLKDFEAARKARQLLHVLRCSREAAGVLGKYDGVEFRILRTEYVPKFEDYRVTFTLSEFWRYIMFIVTRCGLRYEIDGSLTTMDGLKINNSYLGNEMENGK